MNVFTTKKNLIECHYGKFFFRKNIIFILNTKIADVKWKLYLWIKENWYICSHSKILFFHFSSQSKNRNTVIFTITFFFLTSKTANICINLSLKEMVIITKSNDPILFIFRMKTRDGKFFSSLSTFLGNENITHVITIILLLLLGYVFPFTGVYMFRILLSILFVFQLFIVYFSF